MIYHLWEHRLRWDRYCPNLLTHLIYSMWLLILWSHFSVNSFLKLEACKESPMNNWHTASHLSLYLSRFTLCSLFLFTDFFYILCTHAKKATMSVVNAWVLKTNIGNKYSGWQKCELLCIEWNNHYIQYNALLKQYFWQGQL